MCTRFLLLLLAAATLAILPITAAAEVRLVGVCHDNTGKPITGATATLYFSADMMSEIEAVETVQSDQFGAFEFKPTVIETDQHGRTRYWVAVTADEHASFSQAVRSEHLRKQRIEASLHNQPATLIGHITGPDGKPVDGARVFLPSGFNREPIVGVMSATTDKKGLFRITDMAPWRPLNPERQSKNLLVDHPDLARTTASFRSTPQVLRIQMELPAIVTGHVIDAVTNKPVANTVVSAQGVADHGWFQARTNAEGKYTLTVKPDRYNIWAEKHERIAIAVNSVRTTSGETVDGADIRLVRGAIVYGNVIGVGEEEQSANGLHVAHYGPARPRSGAAVTFTTVNPDGTYRLRVAPGNNYLYVMGGSGSIQVDVKDGEELHAHIVPGKRAGMIDDGGKKMRAIARMEKRNRESAKGAELSRDRGNTKAGNLLDQLEVFNQPEFVFHEEWLQTLHDLVQLGPDAIPELIDELDATDDNRMFRCMGFVMRAIGDARAVPALIRAIPRVYVTHGSDMGLRSDNEVLTAFAQQHDLRDRDNGNRYSFGRPVREVFGAIHALTDHDFDDSQIFRVRDTGTRGQRELKRELVQRHAAKWAKWWEANAKNLKVPKEWSVVNLPPIQPANIVPAALGVDYRTIAASSGAILEPVQADKPYMCLIDLDTRRKGTLPARWRNANREDLPLDEIATWARGEGFDLMGTRFRIDEDSQCFAMRLLGARAIQLPEDHWNKRFTQVRLEDLAHLGTPVLGDYLFRHVDGEVDPLGHAPFFIVTAEETPVLFFMGIEVNDDSLKPGGIANGDQELNPVAFRKGRRFGMSLFEPIE